MAGMPRVGVRARLSCLGLACALAAAAALGAGLLRHAPQPAAALPGAHYNRGTNAAWLGVEWVNEPHEEREIAALAQALARHEIRTAYVFASYWKPEVGFNLSYAHAAEFTRALKAAQPGLEVQAWLGLPLVQPWPFGSTRDRVQLGDAAVRARIVAFAVELVREHGFDGVHLDPEPIADGDPGVLALLDEMRRALGLGPTLSIATHRIWPLSCPLLCTGRFFWSAGYYRQVAARVDQVALMTYDSTAPLPQLYREWGRLEAIAITRALEGTNAELFVGIPTSEEETWTHRPRAENMASGLEGLVDGLNDAAARPGVLTGVAIYPYWETDEAEWATYDALWLGK